MVDCYRYTRRYRQMMCCLLYVHRNRAQHTCTKASNLLAVARSVLFLNLNLNLKKVRWRNTHSAKTELN